MDREYQKENWFLPKNDFSLWKNLDPIINFFLDEIYWEQFIDRQIGYTFYDKEEAQSVLQIVRCLQNIIQVIGKEKPNSNYVNSPYWAKLIKTSHDAYHVLTYNESLDSSKD
jgi:hypothetical protein